VNCFPTAFIDLASNGVKETEKLLAAQDARHPAAFDLPPSCAKLAVMRRVRSRAAIGLLAGLLALIPGAAFAHDDMARAPSVSALWSAWEFDPFFVAGAVVAGWLFWQGVRMVNRAHPRSPVPRKKSVYFYSGLAVMVIAIMSPLAAYDTVLFSAHMWQHLLITMVAAPLLLLGSPITLVLRAASPAVRRSVLLPILHSLPIKALAFPVVAWLVFAGTMWASHFSPLFNEALENVWAHRFEHAWYLSAALLFWWPVVAADPTPWRMNHPVRMLYVFLQMPQNSFLALAIYSSSSVLYEHYATFERDWGPTPLGDQQLAGITMWVGGDLLFLIAVAFVAYGWVKHEEREAKRQDRRLAQAKLAANAGETA
jgi:putative membrane protein